ncbi:hypothetical protein I4U23_014154 [Adineta vaga]|nr:hypothetical protein I4U23_014154 [Adineta vaga]
MATSSVTYPNQNSLIEFHSQPSPTVENSIVIWLDTNINPHSSEYYSLLIQMQQFVHLILPFNDPDQCLDYLSDIQNEKVFLIISGHLGKQIIPLLHQFDQINSIYIYCQNRDTHEKWTKNEKQIKGVFTKTEPIFDAFRRDFRQCEDDLCSFSILSSVYNELTESNKIFLYTQLLKDILIQMEYQPNDRINFINHCQSIYENNHYQLKAIEEFRKNYRQSTAIQWYRSECFISSMLNKAFRMRDLDILIPMGFFIRDLHQELLRLYTKQNHGNNFIVYRGQGITEKQFQAILDNQHGFLSFNNYLMTTTDKNLSLTYARFSRDHHQLIGVLFRMEIDQINSIFASLNKLNYDSESENEILLTTQTVFRIHHVDQIENGLWEIQLRLTMDEMEQFLDIENLIQNEKKGNNGPEQLSALMSVLNEFELQTTEITNEQIEESDKHDEVIESSSSSSTTIETNIEQEQNHEEEVGRSLIILQIRDGSMHLDESESFILLLFRDREDN